MKWITRILLVLVAIVAIAVATLSLMGMREGADTLSARVEVNKPVDAVWSHFNDKEKTKKWVSWLVDIKGMTPGKEGVGAREVWVMEDRNNNNALMEIVGEVTNFEPKRRIDVKLSSTEAFDGTASYVFEDLGGGRTALLSTSKYRFGNAFARLMAPVIMPMAKEKLEGDLARFKANVEKE